MKKYGIWILASFALLFQSCSVNSETTYYKDAATSMESKILMDPTLLNYVNAESLGNGAPNIPELGKLSTDWKSLFDLQKNGKIVLNADSAKVLKKVFLKLNKTDGQMSGVSIKYDKLMPQEVASLFQQGSKVSQVPLSNVAQWDGKTLVIDTEKFNSGDLLSELSKDNSQNSGGNAQSRSKQDSVMAYGKQMMQGMLGMLKMFNMSYTSLLKFQKPIKSIEGKHDYVTQVDNKTIRIKVNTRDLLDENKKLIHNDKKIVVSTE